jgi:hypothetical protein
MNFHQSPEEIIKNSDAEQRILWNMIFLRWGDKIGIQQLFFQGAIAASEFLVYSANRLYLCYSMEIGCTVTAAAANTFLQFFNQANASFLNMGNLSLAWDTTAAGFKTVGNNYNLKNFYFSRFTAVTYTQIRFIGYRLAI